jgi:hypothetical protein
MRLVPKQLQRGGMTGNVPYYGGRFSPAQAYAAAHPYRPAPGPALSVVGSAGTSSSPLLGTSPGESAPGPPSVRNQADTLRALQHLLDTGVITKAEYEDLRARIVA